MLEETTVTGHVNAAITLSRKAYNTSTDRSIRIGIKSNISNLESLQELIKISNEQQRETQKK